MVHKVLSIVSKILFGLVTLAFMACLVYTLASPTVQSGLNEISSSVQGIVDSVSSAASQATDAIDAGWQATAGTVSGVAGLAGNATAAAERTTGTGEAEGAGAANGSDATAGTTAAVASNAGTDANASASTDAAAAALADTAQGQAYLSWKSAVADPVARVFGNTSVTEALLEGVAGGSTSASGVLTGMDETVLVAISASANNYATSAAANAVPSTLPESVRTQMWEANSAAQGFAAAVQSIVEAVRGARGGNLLSLGDLMSAADDAVQSARTLDACLSTAEAALQG